MKLNKSVTLSWIQIFPFLPLKFMRKGYKGNSDKLRDSKILMKAKYFLRMRPFLTNLKKI